MMLVITPFLWRRLCDVWLTPSLWRQARLEGPTLHETGKSLSVWMRLLPIGPKDHMQKRYCVTRHSLLPMGRKGKSLRVWVRLGKTKGPHAIKVLHGALSPAAHGGIGESLRVWVRLGRTNRPHAKRGTYHVSVFGFWLVCGSMMSLWHFRLSGTLGEVFGFEIILDIF